MSQFNKPVLLLAYNDASTTKRVLDAIRSVKPLKLYFAIDGPHHSNNNEVARVEAVRDLVQMID